MRTTELLPALSVSLATQAGCESLVRSSPGLSLPAYARTDCRPVTRVTTLSTWYLSAGAWIGAVMRHFSPVFSKAMAGLLHATSSTLVTFSGLGSKIALGPPSFFGDTGAGDERRKNSAAPPAATQMSSAMVVFGFMIVSGRIRT